MQCPAVILGTSIFAENLHVLGLFPTFVTASREMMSKISQRRETSLS